LGRAKCRRNIWTNIWARKMGLTVLESTCKQSLRNLSTSQAMGTITIALGEGYLERNVRMSSTSNRLVLGSCRMRSLSAAILFSSSFSSARCQGWEVWANTATTTTTDVGRLTQGRKKERVERESKERLWKLSEVELKQPRHQFCFWFGRKVQMPPCPPHPQELGWHFSTVVVVVVCG